MSSHLLIGFAFRFSLFAQVVFWQHTVTQGMHATVALSSGHSERHQVTTCDRTQ